MDAGAVGGIATAGTALAGAAAAVGRFSAGASRKHRSEVEKREHDEADRENTLLELTWALNGRPATQWEPAKPGMRDNVQRLADDFAAHSKEDMDRFREVAAQNKAVAEQLAEVAGLFKDLKENP